jgi:hypothetical protein
MFNNKKKLQEQLNKLQQDMLYIKTEQYGRLDGFTNDYSLYKMAGKIYKLENRTEEINEQNRILKENWLATDANIDILVIKINQLMEQNEQFKFFISELGYEVTPHKKQWKLTKKEK